MRERDEQGVLLSDEWYYPHTDHLGSVHILTRHSDGYVEAGSLARYEPFGAWRTEPTTNPALSGRGYTGHRHNNTGANDLGLIYMRARFYVPSIGRFASADTIVPEPDNPQSFNRFSYTLNNPVRYTDPTGHVCYDPGIDAAMPGNCNGSSEPLTPPMSSGLSLEDWEIQLIAMVAYFETAGTPEHRESVIWTIVNRLNSPAFSDSVEELLVGTQYHISLRNPNAKGIYQHGIFAPYKDPNRVGVLSGRALSDAAFGYYSNLPRYSADLNDAMDQAQNVVNNFNSGGIDPTGGTVYFAHGPNQEWAETTQTNLEKQAEIDGLSSDLSVTVKDGSSHIVLNNIYDPPFGKYPLSGGYCTTYAISLCKPYNTHTP